MRKILLALAVLLAPLSAYGQAVQQSGSVTPGHVPYWVTNGVQADGGTASDSPISSIGVTNNGGNGICVSTGRSTAAGRQQLCLSASLNSAGVISLQNYGTATAQNLEFLINGTAIIIPTGGGSAVPTITLPLVNNDAICASGTNGVLKDCGVAIGAGTQFGVPYYSTTAIISSTIAGTNGQVFLGQTGAAPVMTTLSGDVASVSSSGALTLQKVNGVPFPVTYTPHSVLLGEGTSQFGQSITTNVGYCLISQGVSTDPIWAPCASGSGSAGGANTQVQFNNSSSLAGSANLTWVSPTLTIGATGSGTGQLALAGLTSGIITVQGQAIAGTYNFNLPTTAGTAGQPLLSGGGSSSAMTFGTLGISGGGTNCIAASGTCLDNITGFASNGYIKRTGSGSYTQVSPIPVSDGGTNLASGTSGGILGYTASGILASSAALTANGIVIGGGAGATPTSTAAGTNGQLLVGQTSSAPAWAAASGDISSISAGGAFTIATNAVTVGKMAQAGANTFLGNPTTSTANVQAFTIGSLSLKASPGAADQVVISDQSASGALKYATVSSIASAGSVGSVGGLTGAIGVTNGIATSGSNLVHNSGSYTLQYVSAAWTCMDPAGATVSIAGSTTSGLQECILAMQANKTGALRAICPDITTVISASTTITFGPAGGYLYDLRGCTLTSTAAATAIILDTFGQGTNFDWAGGYFHCQITGAAGRYCVDIKPSSADPVNGGKITQQSNISLPYINTDAACSSGSIPAILHVNPNTQTTSAVVNNKIDVQGLDGNAANNCAATGLLVDAPSIATNAFAQNIVTILLVANYKTRGIDVGGAVSVVQATQPLATNEWHVSVNVGVGGTADMIRTSGFRDIWFIPSLSVNAGGCTNAVNLVGGGTAGTPTGASDNTFYSNQIDATSGCSVPIANWTTTFRNSFVGSGTFLGTYTPTLSCNTGTLTSASATGLYSLVGHTVQVQVGVSVTTNGTCAGNIVFTLPWTADGNSVLAGKEVALTGKMVSASIPANSANATMVYYDNSFPGANSTSFFLSGSYLTP